MKALVNISLFVNNEQFMEISLLMKIGSYAFKMLKGKVISYSDLLLVYEYNEDNVFVICLIIARVSNA